MTKFVILSLPRTGSTLLSKSLNKHSEIFCDDEIFHFSFKDYFSPNQFRFLKLRLLPKKINYVFNYPFTFLRLKKFLDNYYTNKTNENFKARGFKLMHYQTFYLPGIVSYLKKNNIKVILLLRENIFRNALSDLRARSTGIYHNENDAQKKLQSVPKLHVNILELKNKMNSIINQNKKLSELVKDIDHIKIYYEDFTNWSETMSRIFDFLKVSNEEITAGTKKLIPENLEDMVENYTELKAWLKTNNLSD